MWSGDTPSGVPDMEFAHLGSEELKRVENLKSTLGISCVILCGYAEMRRMCVGWIW